MTGDTCCIATCKNTSYKARKEERLLRFFRLPKDKRILKIWIKKCGGNKWDAVKNRICSKHFKPGDFEDEIQARILNLHPKKLKKDAIPSLFLNSNEQEHEKSEIPQIMLQEEREKIIEASNHSSSTSQTPLKIIENDNFNENIDIDHIQTCIFKQKLELLQNENITLKKKNANLENNKNILKLQISGLKQQIKNEARFEDKVKVAFKDILTSNQIEIALGKKSKAQWTTEEISRAFTLRYLSERSYIYLRETLHYPLPSLRTLRHWTANINLKNGILDSD